MNLQGSKSDASRALQYIKKCHDYAQKMIEKGTRPKLNDFTDMNLTFK